MDSNPLWTQADLYGAVENAAPPTADKTTESGAVQRGASISWLAIVLLFFAFRILYEVAE